MKKMNKMRMNKRMKPKKIIANLKKHYNKMILMMLILFRKLMRILKSNKKIKKIRIITLN